MNEPIESYCVLRDPETGDRSRFFKNVSTAESRAKQGQKVITRTKYVLDYDQVDPLHPTHKSN